MELAGVWERGQLGLRPGEPARWSPSPLPRVVSPGPHPAPGEGPASPPAPASCPCWTGLWGPRVAVSSSSDSAALVQTGFFLAAPRCPYPPCAAVCRPCLSPEIVCASFFVLVSLCGLYVLTVIFCRSWRRDKGGFCVSQRSVGVFLMSRARA